MTFETSNTVCPELVEGLSFFRPGKRAGEGFDKLSPNGFPGMAHV